MATVRIDDPRFFDHLESHTPPGSYSLHTNKQEISSHLTRFAASETSGDFRGLLVLHGGMTDRPHKIGGLLTMPNATVARIRRLRLDDTPDGFSADIDDTLIFRSQDGSVCRRPFKAGDHQTVLLSTQTNLEGVLDVHRLTGLDRHGSIQSLRANGVLVSFST